MLAHLQLSLAAEDLHILCKRQDGIDLRAAGRLSGQIRRKLSGVGLHGQDARGHSRDHAWDGPLEVDRRCRVDRKGDRRRRRRVGRPAARVVAMGNGRTASQEH
ncbi:MAG TPA: hypothetical protein VNM16_05035 [Bacillota bacterium]|nr:hypothetical protein [Bacillota bacterium]